MLTLKFLASDNSDEHQSNADTVLCCERYDVRATEFGFTIIAYTKLHSSDAGAEFHVGGDRGHDACFVENLAGKTINHYRSKPGDNRELSATE